MRTDVLNSSSGKNLKETKNIILAQDTTTINLSVEESGSLVILRACGGAKLIDLPPASGNGGVYYDFCINEALDDAVTIQSKDGTDYFLGTVADGESATTAQVAWNGSSRDQFVFASGAAAGEFEGRFVCDGDNWLIMFAISQDISDVSAAASSSNTRTV